MAVLDSSSELPEGTDGGFTGSREKGICGFEVFQLLADLLKGSGVKNVPAIRIAKLHLGEAPRRFLGVKASGVNG